MILNFEYTAKDFQEATKAQTKFFAGSDPVSRKKKRLRRLVVWAVITLFLILLEVMTSRRGTPTVTTALVPPEAATEQPTHNFLMTAIPAVFGPIFTFALLAWAFSKSSQRVPFYKTLEIANGRRIILLCIAIASTLVGIGSVVLFCLVPTAPNWRADTFELLLLNFLPWFLWALALFGVMRINQKRLPGRFGHAQSSTRMPQTLELTDSRIVVSTSLARHEYEWAYFVSYLESENLVQLYTRDLTVVIVPKRAFTSYEVQLQLFALVPEKISAGRFLPRASGFPVLPGPARQTTDQDRIPLNVGESQ